MFVFVLQEPINFTSFSCCCVGFVYSSGSQSKSSLFAAVSFDIVAGATNKSMYEEHCSFIIEVFTFYILSTTLMVC